MRKQAGVTIVELMIALIVLGTLLAIGLPSFLQAMANARTTALANEMATAMALARSEAVKRSGSVVVCPRAEDSDPVTPTCGDAWSDANGSFGWIVAYAPGDVVPAGAIPEDQVIRIWGPADTTEAYLDGGAQIANLGGTRFLFNRNGRVTLADAGALVLPATFSLSFKNCKGEQQRDFILGATGRLSVARGYCPE